MRGQERPDPVHVELLAFVFAAEQRHVALFQALHPMPAIINRARDRERPVAADEVDEGLRPQAWLAVLFLVGVERDGAKAVLLRVFDLAAALALHERAGDLLKALEVVNG